MKDFKKLLSEVRREKQAVITFGRFNPPTSGHEKLIDKVIKTARKLKAEPLVYAMHSQDSKKNPLSYRQKIKYLKMGMPKAKAIIVDTNIDTIFGIIEDLDEDKYTSVTLVVGSDRVKEFSDMFRKYSDFDNIRQVNVISAGERDPDADDVSGMSASKMRELAKNGDLEGFKKGVSSGLNDRFAEQMYNDVRKGMGIK